MKTFNLAGFAAHLGKVAVEMAVAEHEVLEHAAKIVEKEAKAEIGSYQGAAGPFAAWPELADATKADRAAKGFTPNDPLLRTGALRDSIEHTVHGHEAHVGSNSDIAVYQELGTSRGIPPRSFLGGAAFRKGPEVAADVGSAVVSVLAGGTTRIKIGGG